MNFMNFFKQNKIVISTGLGVLCSFSAYSMEIDIFHAARTGNVARIQELIRAGTDPNQKNDFGWTPFHVAAYHGHQAVAETLIRAGADPNLKTNYGYTPLYWATFHGHQEVVNLIKQAIKQRAQAFTSGLHERLGAESPLQLLNGFEWISRFIVAHGGLSAKEELPELL